ncbi:hypothetical protein J4E83_005466 [Alternaria metachromatica]|uniref:uncharacterized protein n=1 Tax=Alternaria metachromatica TaxID=283354 RepID=UPI0020C58A6A|nr:uncharacterized protein J4E83_005466 [Alternaria metachromatica]KAI4619611.1 hypothetical protein J4E83_005466 [Alternaria metachromatica]
MDLPSELRLMVYKRLPRQIKHTEVRYLGYSWPDTEVKLDSTFVLITRHLPVAILRTSRQVYAEAHSIVTALIKSFVTESEPRAIGREDNGNAFLLLATLIATERTALLTGQPYHVSDVIQRHPYLASHPWETRRPRDIAIFFGQTTLAKTPDTRIWVAKIATVYFEKQEDVIDTLRTQHSSSLAPGPPPPPASVIEMFRREYESGLGEFVRTEMKGTIAYAPNEEYKVTAKNVPVILNVDKFDLDGTLTLETCMSQDDWTGHWVASS